MNELKPFLYFIIGVIICVLLTGLFEGAFKNKPDFSDCLYACEKEGINRPTNWEKMCKDKCINAYFDRE